MSELSEEEKTLCSSVAANWTAAGQLVFKRKPNYLAIAFATVIAIAFLTNGLVVMSFDTTTNGFDYRFGLNHAALFVAAAVWIVAIWVIFRARRPGDSIVLTPYAFEEHNRGRVFGRRRSFAIPWASIAATEETSGTPTADTPGAKIVVTDKRTNRELTYRSWTTERYKEFRAALILRAGLTIRHTVNRREVY